LLRGREFGRKITRNGMEKEGHFGKIRRKGEKKSEKKWRSTKTK
jgi:hypothetical protein